MSCGGDDELGIGNVMNVRHAADKSFVLDEA